MTNQQLLLLAFMLSVSSSATAANNIPLSQVLRCYGYTYNNVNAPNFRRRRRKQQSSRLDGNYILSNLLQKSSSSVASSDSSWSRTGCSHNFFCRSFSRISMQKSFEVRPLILWKCLSYQLSRVTRQFLKFLQRVSSNSYLLDRTFVLAKLIIFAVIGVEVFFTVRDTWKEVLCEYQEMMGENEVPEVGSGFRGIWSRQGNVVLSSESVRKLIMWLQEADKRLRSPPPSDISPSWMVPLAEELRECEGLPLVEIQRILQQLTKPEALMLQSCLLPSSRKVDFDHIGGLLSVKGFISRWIESALAGQKKSLVGHQTLSNAIGPNSLCLWGPSGCGKSLLLRSIAQKSGLPTLAVTPSLLKRKFYGESTERARTFFKLVDILGSCVVVLDEIDGLFMPRKEEDHEVTRELQTEWLQWWDGVNSVTNSSSLTMKQIFGTNQRKVLFVAATNRPWDVDTAAWRRLGHRVYVGLPHAIDRHDLLHLWTKDVHSIDPIVLQYIVGSTEGFTPSDMHNLLLWACHNGPIAREDGILLFDDIRLALSEISPTRFSTQYVSKLQNFMSSNRHHAADGDSLGRQGDIRSNGAFFDHSLATMLPNEDGGIWRTPLGNFYVLQVPVDSSLFDTMQEMFWTHRTDKDDWYWSDMDDDDDDDFDDDSDYDV